MRRLIALALLLATACTPIPPPPASPTAAATVTVSVVASPIPIVTLTATMPPLVTIVPTAEPPIRTMQMVARSYTPGTVDVMAVYCEAKTTTLAFYDWGVVYQRDNAGYEACVAGGVF